MMPSECACIIELRFGYAIVVVDGILELGLGDAIIDVDGSLKNHHRAPASVNKVELEIGDAIVDV